MNAIVVAAPSDTTPPTKVIPGGSYGLLTFDFTMVLGPSETLTTANLAVSDSTLITVTSQSVQSKLVQFLILTTMADGQTCNCSCTITTSTGNGDARAIRFVAYDSGISSSSMPINPSLLVQSATITPGLVNDGTTIILPTIAVAGAAINSACIMATRDPLPAGVYCYGNVTSPGVVTPSIQNDNGSPQTLPSNLFTATVIIA